MPDHVYAAIVDGLKETNSGLEYLTLTSVHGISIFVTFFCHIAAESWLDSCKWWSKLENLSGPFTTGPSLCAKKKIIHIPDSYIRSQNLISHIKHHNCTFDLNGTVHLFWGFPLKVFVCICSTSTKTQKHEFLKYVKGRTLNFDLHFLKCYLVTGA